MSSPSNTEVSAEAFQAIAGQMGTRTLAAALMAEDRLLTPGELGILEDAARWWIRMHQIAGRQAEAIAARLAAESARTATEPAGCRR